MEACGINFFYLRAVFPLTLMLATASAQVCVPLGHSSLYWHMLLVNDDDDDDDDVGISLVFLYDSATFCVFLKIFFCACGCVHDKLAQYAFILLH